MMNGMNGYEKQHLDDDTFGASSGNIVSAFDAFRKLPIHCQGPHNSRNR